MANHSVFVHRVSEIIHDFRHAKGEHRRHTYQRLEHESKRFVLHKPYGNSLSDDDAKHIFDAAVFTSLPDLINPKVHEKHAAEKLETELKSHRDAWKNIYKNETTFQIKPKDNQKYDTPFAFEPAVQSEETLVNEHDHWAAVAESVAILVPTALHLLSDKDHDVIVHFYGLGEPKNNKNVEFKHRSAHNRAARRALERFNTITEHLTHMAIVLHGDRPDVATLKQALRVIQGKQFINVISVVQEHGQRRVRGKS